MADKIKKDYDLEDEILALFDEIECPLNEERDSPFVDDEDVEELNLLLSSKITYTRLKEYFVEEDRNFQISQLADFDFALKKYDDFFNYLSSIKRYIEKIIQRDVGVPSFFKLNQLLRMFQLHKLNHSYLKSFR